MKIYQEITPLKVSDIFVVLDSSNNGFDYPIHNHPEYELNFITGISGTRIVGDSTERYENSDLVLIGPNLFHKWEGDVEPLHTTAPHDIAKTLHATIEKPQETLHATFSHDIAETLHATIEKPQETLYATSEKPPETLHATSLHYRVITIQFGIGLFNGQFFQKERFYKIRKLLQDATKGIRFFGKTQIEAGQLMQNLTQDKGFKNVIEFLELLNLLSESEECSLLSSAGFVSKDIKSESKRIQTVYSYILKNFSKTDLKIHDVAAHINMNDSAFSHFFHKLAFRSYTDFLVDIRLGNVCKLMLDTDETIGQISYQSGFNNIANFNRLFKKYRHCTPVEYRKRYTEKNTFDWENQITPQQFMPSNNKTKKTIEPQFTTQLVHV